MPSGIRDSGYAFLVEIGDRPGLYWNRYERYISVDRVYEYAGGPSFEAADELGQHELGQHGNPYRVVEVATGLPVTARMIAERAPPAGAERTSMITLNVKRKGGRVFLLVNAKGMHDILDSIGVPAVNGVYSDRPRATDLVANRTTHIISTEALLRKEYPAEFDLSVVYGADHPPNIANLQRLTESAFEQTRKILEHYQPIDITVSIQAGPKKDK